MLKYIGLMLATLVLGVTAAVADPVGKYQVEGTNPSGKGTYRGTVTVEKTGETYRVIWLVGDTKFIGTGIGNKDFMAVSYKSGNESGLALYGSDGDDWTGVWTYSGGINVGTENWKRQ